MLEHLADAPRDVLRRVLVEALHVDHAGAETAPVAVLLPELGFAHLAARELQHELVGARLQHAREIRLVGAEETRTTETISETNMKTELGLDTVGRQVEEPRHLFAGNIASGRLIELDPVSARRDQALQLVIDDLGEALSDVDDALVCLAGMNA